MIVHSVETAMLQPPSAYESAYYPQAALGDARPLSLVASNPPAGASQDDTPASSGDVAPCYVHRGIGDSRSWSSVVASCEGRLVPVGAHAPEAPPQPLWLNDGSSRRIALKFLEAEAGAPAQPTLLAGLSLMLATLTVFFFTKAFVGERS